MALGWRKLRATLVARRVPGCTVNAGMVYEHGSEGPAVLREIGPKVLNPTLAPLAALGLRVQARQAGKGIRARGIRFLRELSTGAGARESPRENRRAQGSRHYLELEVDDRDVRSVVTRRPGGEVGCGNAMDEDTSADRDEVETRLGIQGLVPLGQVGCRAIGIDSSIGGNDSTEEEGAHLVGAGVIIDLTHFRPGTVESGFRRRDGRGLRENAVSRPVSEWGLVSASRAFGATGGRGRRRYRASTILAHALRHATFHEHLHFLRWPGLHHGAFGSTTRAPAEPIQSQRNARTSRWVGTCTATTLACAEHRAVKCSVRVLRRSGLGKWREWEGCARTQSRNARGMHPSRGNRGKPGEQAQASEKSGSPEEPALLRMRRSAVVTHSSRAHVALRLSALFGMTAEDLRDGRGLARGETRKRVEETYTIPGHCAIVCTLPRAIPPSPVRIVSYPATATSIRSRSLQGVGVPASLIEER
ncbi:hypothetical protein B0H11DRAFT_1924908 [Mycena galericulata]|nr:hypothetical protein B0H11DRAFT_1924908 [Mycena galericulata]